MMTDKNSVQASDEPMRAALPPMPKEECLLAGVYAHRSSAMAGYGMICFTAGRDAIPQPSGNTGELPPPAYPGIWSGLDANRQQAGYTADQMRAAMVMPSAAGGVGRYPPVPVSILRSALKNATLGQSSYGTNYDGNKLGTAIEILIAPSAATKPGEPGHADQTRK